VGDVINSGRFRLLWLSLPNPGPQTLRCKSLFAFINETVRKSASLEPVIGLLALAVGK